MRHSSHKRLYFTQKELTRALYGSGTSICGQRGAKETEQPSGNNYRTYVLFCSCVLCQVNQIGVCVACLMVKSVANKLKYKF